MGRSVLHRHVQGQGDHRSGRYSVRGVVQRPKVVQGSANRRSMEKRRGKIPTRGFQQLKGHILEITFFGHNSYRLDFWLSYDEIDLVESNKCPRSGLAWMRVSEFAYKNLERPFFNLRTTFPKCDDNGMDDEKR